VGSRIINGEMILVFWFSVFPGRSWNLSAGNLPRSALQMQRTDLAVRAL
jgi:hypothetical protein